MSESHVETFCPNCDAPVSVLEARCYHCGKPFETLRHRSGIGGSVWGGLVALLWFTPAACILDYAFTTTDLHVRITGGGLYVFGLVTALAGLIIDWLDLRGIRAGRLNPDRRTGILVGMWLCGFTVLLYWCFICFQIAKLL